MTAATTTAADLIDRFDIRDIRELTVDDGSEASGVNVATDPKIRKAIESAEGEVRSALARGGRYTTLEINALTGVDLEFYKTIVCEFAMLRLLRRRPRFDAEALKSQETLRENYLKQLTSGDAILGGVQEDIEAGRASVDGPTISELNNQNFWRTRSSYFPAPVMPRGRNT